MHIRIRADAGVAEQIPGAAQALARFQNQDRLLRQALAQMHRTADAREACAHDQGINMLDVHAANTREKRPMDDQ